MVNAFDFGSFIGRWIFSLLLVFGTYNPTRFSYIRWLFAEGTQFGPILAIIGLVLLIGWIIFLRATSMSMGLLGVGLMGALLACIVWLLVDVGLLNMKSEGAFSWVALFLLSLLLAVGMSWSHIRRRLSGQTDIDSLEDGRG